MLPVMIIVIAQNLYSWMKFGVFRHNEFYDVRTGDFKSMAFIKSTLSIICLLWIAEYISFRKLPVNYILIFTFAPILLLGSRHFFFG